MQCDLCASRVQRTSVSAGLQLCKGLKYEREICFVNENPLGYHTLNPNIGKRNVDQKIHYTNLSYIATKQGIEHSEIHHFIFHA